LKQENLHSNSLSYDGPKLHSAWNLNINESLSDFSWYYANIYDNISRYFTISNFWSIKSPIVNYNVPINVFCNTGSGVCLTTLTNNGGYVNYISMYRCSPQNVKYDSKDIFRNSIHETAHVSYFDINHFQYDTYKYYKVDNKVVESWAICVANKLTLAKYNTTSDKRDYQRMSFTELLAPEWGGLYTPVFIDLIDNENQREIYQNNDYPIDRVSGYSLQQIESSLKTNSDLESIKTYLLNTYDNSTETYMDELFNNYINL